MPLTVSVVGARRVIGVVTAEYLTQHPEDLETLAPFAPLLAAALELAHLHRRERDRLRDERLRAEMPETVSRLHRGDITLIRITDVLRSTLSINTVPILNENETLSTRWTGCAYRVGGDEFHLLLSFDRGEASQMIHALTQQVQSLEIEGEGASLPVGLNVGLAEYPLERSTLDLLQSLADDRMYAAKRAHIPMLGWSSESP